MQACAPTATAPLHLPGQPMFPNAIKPLFLDFTTKYRHGQEENRHETTALHGGICRNCPCGVFLMFEKGLLYDCILIRRKSLLDHRQLLVVRHQYSHWGLYENTDATLNFDQRNRESTHSCRDHI